MSAFVGELERDRRSREAFPKLASRSLEEREVI
jgi:hypothetical protein